MRNSEKCAAIAAALTLVWLGLSPVDAQQETGEARMRAALRSTTAQLRDLQDQNAALMAKQAENDRERMALTQRIAAGERELAGLRQQAKTGQTISDQATAQLNAQKEAFATTDADYKENLAKWQAAYNEAAETARTRDADAKRFEATLVQVRGRVQSCETKNTELFKLGKEVLDLQDNRDFVDRLGAAEPITKLKRVQFENLMQDYEDKMRANEIARPGK